MKININPGNLSVVLLTICFVVLKATGYIDWAWHWVLAPLWIPLALWLLVAGGYAALLFIAALLDR